MENQNWFVSNGNSVGEYSDYYPVNFNSAQEAESWAANGDFPDGYTVWSYDPEDGEIITA